MLEPRMLKLWSGVCWKLELVKQVSYRKSTLFFSTLYKEKCNIVEMVDSILLTESAMFFVEIDLTWYGKKLEETNDDEIGKLDNFDFGEQH